MSKLKTNLLVGVVAAASVLTLVSCGGNNSPVSVDANNGGVANNGTANTVKPVVVFDLKDAYKPYVKGGVTKDNLYQAVEITDLTSGKAVPVVDKDVNLVNGKVYVRAAQSLKAGDKYKVTLYTVNDALAQEANSNPQEPSKSSMEFTVASGVTGTDQIVFAGPNQNTKSAGSFNFVGLSNDSNAVSADKIELVAHVKGKDQPVIKNLACDAPSGGATTGAQVTTCSFTGVNTDKDTKLTFKPAANSGLTVNNKDGKVEEKIKETTAKVVQSEVSYGVKDPKVSIRFSAPVLVTDVAKFFYNNAANESAVVPVTLNKAPVKIEAAKDLLGSNVANGVAYYFVPSFSEAPNVTFGSQLKFETAKKSALKDAYGNEVKVNLTVTPTVHSA